MSLGFMDSPPAENLQGVGNHQKVYLPSQVFLFPLFPRDVNNMPELVDLPLNPAVWFREAS